MRKRRYLRYRRLLKITKEVLVILSLGLGIIIALKTI